MKKIITKIVTVLAVTLLTLSSFVGCALVTTDTEKDYAQTVASVCIDDAKIEAENIAKREVISGYLSYGYNYVVSYGYTQSKAYALVLDNLLTNRVIVQKARIELAEQYNALVASGSGKTDFETNLLNDALANKTAIDFKKGDVETLKKYLTEYEVAAALYNVKKSVNSMIESYETDDHDHDDETEDETFTARASAYVAPESVTDEYELKDVTPEDYDYKVADVILNEGWETLKGKYSNKRDLNLAVYNAYKIDLSTAAKKKAFNKAVKTLKKNGLILNSESVNFSGDSEKVLEYSYFANLLKTQYESAVVSKYEASLHDEVDAKIDDNALWNQYVIDYNQQKFNYTNDRSAYETALGNADKDKFVICNPYDGKRYGYVANLLIGFTDEQTALLSAKSSEKGVTPAEIKEYRSELLNGVVAKDQRATWAQSNYGTYKDGKFVFENKYFASEKSVAKLGSYIGEIFGADSATAKNDDKVEETKWSFKNIVSSSIPFDTFVSDYLGDLGMNKLVYNGADSTVGKVNVANFDEIKDRFDDLIYAFSTDPGSLGKYYGYVYSPAGTSFVKEFEDAAAALVKAGKGAYTIVATDYGYHVMLCTKVIDGTDSDEYIPGDSVKGETKFKEDIKTEGTFAYNYRETKFDSIAEKEVSKIANQLINGFKKDKVTKYRDVYSDLITDSADLDDYNL